MGFGRRKGRYDNSGNRGNSGGRGRGGSVGSGICTIIFLGFILLALGWI